MSVIAEFRVPRSAFRVGPVLEEFPDVSVDVERVVPTGESTQYVWVEGAGRKRFVEALQAADPVGTVTVVDEFPDWLLVRLELLTDPTPTLDLVEGAGATTVGVRGSHDGWILTVRGADESVLGDLYETFLSHDLPLDLLALYDADTASSSEAFDLTAPQYETLAAAYESGYFEVPRQVTLTELAARFDVSEQAISERLRRGLFSVVTTAVADRNERDAAAGD